MPGATLLSLHEQTALASLTVSKEAIAKNIETFQRKLPPQTRIMAIVKAAGYGTDSLQLSRCLANCGIDLFGVASCKEAIDLRSAGFQEELFVIHAPFPHLKHIVHHNLQVGISDSHAITTLNSLAKEENKSIKVHLHVDTGMHRFGCQPTEALLLAKQINESSHLQLEGLFSHFHSADLPEKDSESNKQIALFSEVLQQIETEGIPIPWKHLANTSGASRFTLPQCNMVRLGIGLLGAHLNSHLDQTLPLTPALTLTTSIVDIQPCKKGERVSYGGTHKVLHDKMICGVLGIGYHDGLMRSFSNRGSCYVNEVEVPLIGAICMDFALVDLTHIKETKIGDKATLFGITPCGKEIPPHRLSATGNTHAHELLSGIGKRVARYFI